jgi:hypothetical protein
MLWDKVLYQNGRKEISKGFGGITDMKVGPDGYLYVLSLYAGGDDCSPIYQPGNLCISETKPMNGAIFRIVPR